MSLATVTDLSHEVRRLAIAGAALGNGDHRLQKLLPPLQAAGKTVPVFDQLARKTEALLEAKKSNAAVALLELNALTSAVLKTQGKIGIEGELVPTEIDDSERSRTQALSYDEIIELKTSLLNNGGDLRDIRRAYKRGKFSDVRMAEQAVQALQAHSIGVADFAVTHLLPPHGKSIVPLLVNALEPSERKVAQRTLKTIYHCDPDSGVVLARQILDPAAPQQFKVACDNASPEVRSTALQMLSNNESDTGLLHDHMKAKVKILRVSATQTLLRHGSPEARSRLDAMLQGSETKINEAIESLPDCLNETDRAFVLNRGHQYQASFKSKKITTGDAKKLMRILELLGDSAPHQDTYDFLREIIRDTDALCEHWTVKNEESVLRCLDYLIKGCHEFGQPAKDLTICLKAGHRDLAVRILQDYGPADALEFFSVVEKKTRNRALFEIFQHRSLAKLLPPPDQWTQEWVAFSLDNQLFDLAFYLMAGLPTQVLEHILQEMQKLDQVELLFALAIDPASAAQLSKKKFGFGNRNKTLYITLLDSVIQRDLSEVNKCLDIMEGSAKSIFRNHPEWISACRKKLNKYLA